MSGSGRTRFDWFKAVYAEPEFTEGDKVVLGYIVIIYIRASPTFCVRQSVIAQRCGVSEITVGRAIRKAKRLGYLVLARERKRGPGQDKADELKLMFPAGYDPEKRTNNLTGHSESDLSQTPERPNKFDPNDLSSTSERPITANSLTSQNGEARGVRDRGESTRGALRGAQRDSQAIAPRDDSEEIIDAEILDANESFWDRAARVARERGL